MQLAQKGDGAGLDRISAGVLAHPFRSGDYDHGHPKSKFPPLRLCGEQQVPHRAFSPIRNDILIPYTFRPGANDIPWRTLAIPGQR